MRIWARVSLVLIVVLIIAWGATAYLGPAMLERQVIASATSELRDLERAVLRENPNSLGAEKTFGMKLPIVRVAFLRTPFPLIFEARTEVEVLPKSGEMKVAQYFYTPWRVYERKVIERIPIVPPLSDPVDAFRKEWPNQAVDRMPGSNAPRESDRH
jgi:hypothetical protein